MSQALSHPPASVPRLHLVRDDEYAACEGTHYIIDRSTPLFRIGRRPVTADKSDGKVKRARRRLRDGFYDRPELVDAILENVAADLR